MLLECMIHDLGNMVLYVILTMLMSKKGLGPALCNVSDKTNTVQFLESTV